MNQETFDNIKEWIENNSQTHYTDGGLYLYESVDKYQLLDEMDRIMIESPIKHQDIMIVKYNEMELAEIVNEYRGTNINAETFAKKIIHYLINNKIN